MKPLVPSLALAFALLLPGAAAAQSRLTGADLDGSVVDESGAALAGAAISVQDLETGLLRTAATDGRGRYAVPALAPGRYKVGAALKGFGSQSREGVVLQLGQSLTLDFKLKLAGTAEELTVSSGAAVVELAHTEV